LYFYIKTTNFNFFNENNINYRRRRLIGSALAEKLLQNSDNFVIIVDNLTTGEIGKLPDAPKERMQFINCDVNNYRDIAGVMLSYHFDYVFHYAAIVGVRRTQQHPG